ncbi:MAG: hypothetical protein NZ843_02475, partial [Fimbriimonadales bacterium]|nr:hypothetical protein [Fimbriimonadales bacterium]
MKRYWLAVCLVLMMRFGMAQEGDAPFLDGATRPEPRATAPAKPPTLIAPQAQPTRITLPPTQRPFRGDAAEGESTAQPKL